MQEYLDKQKFLTKFSAFEGYLHYIDGKYDEKFYGISREKFEEAKNNKIKNYNRAVFTESFYGDFVDEEILVQIQNCGGSNMQPLCLYDFTVK